MQNIQKVFCPSCGAPVTFLEGRDDTFCSSCGHQLFREDTQLETKLKHEENMERIKVDWEAKNKLMFIITMAVAIVFCSLIVIASFIFM